MTTELNKLKKKLKPHLRKGDFSFIGPVNEDLLAPFFELAMLYSDFDDNNVNSIHYLSNKKVIDFAIADLPAGVSLRLYVMHSENGVISEYYTVNDYCKMHSIKLG